jgi:uncharacterized membrane protein (DUF4010 family)
MDLEVFRVFAEALAIGLLIGSERYRGKREGEFQTAGIRTFPIIALLGASSALLEQVSFTALSFSAIVIFLALGYYRDHSQSYGLTTEMAALLTFWLGYLLRDYEVLAISTGIVLVILLASKKPLHEFVRRQVSETEFIDTLKFLAVVFVVFPLLPNRYVGPLEFFNPTQVWMLIILISSIGYAGYILVRIFGSRKGLTIGAILGGVVSTTAVTLSLAARAREVPALSRLCGVTGVLANAVQFPRLLFLVWVVDRSLFLALVPPLGAMALVGLAGGLVLTRLPRSGGDVEPVEPLLKNPFSLWPVLKFGLFFVAVFFLSRVANSVFGEEGLYVTGAVAGLGGVSAIALSMADMVGHGAVSITTAATTVLIAVAANGLLKWTLSLANGTRELAFWLGGGFATMVLTGALVLWLAVPA